MITRRTFIKNTALACAILNLPNFTYSKSRNNQFKISLAEWSLHNTIFGNSRERLGWEKFAEGLRTDSQSTLNGKISNLDFPVVARNDFEIEAVEYVNQFFLDKARDEKYLSELNNICAQEGVTNLLIMVDMEGNLAASDKEERLNSIENHKKWIDAAAFLGCHSIRVNLYGDGSSEEQGENSADSLNALAEYGDKHGVNVIVENHGGYSSDPDWIVRVMKSVNHTRVGTLPDFGNFPDEVDKYDAVYKMMPYAKGVSAKSTKFDEDGNEANIDYMKMMKIVLDSGYDGYVGIEFGGSMEEEYEGIRKTKNLLERVWKELQ